ncbi:hypothetical protein H5T88_06465 [bacterium]|nr:hypothetical protein [bacterium]
MERFCLGLNGFYNLIVQSQPKILKWDPCAWDGTMNKVGMPPPATAPRGIYTFDIKVQGACPKEDDDKCIITNPPCSFPNGIAKNAMEVRNGSDGGAGGQFGELNENGQFVPWSDWRSTRLINDYTYIYYKCPENFTGIISLTFQFDDIPEANDPDKPERLNPIQTFDDKEVWSDPVKLTVWDFTITDCKEDWLPEYEKDADFVAEITPQADHKGNSLSSYIWFYLDSSQEPGICKNKDVPSGKELEQKWDLQFEPGQSELEVYSSDPQNEPYKNDRAVTKLPVRTAVVKVKCYDYGAYGELYALANLPSGLDFAHIKGNPDKFIVRIPVDNDLNYIGDAWEFNGPYASPQDDTDDYPPSNFLGDGLSRYDEYRGFFVKGGYKRLNPGKKDIFVFDQTNLGEASYEDFKELKFELHFWDFQNADFIGKLVTIHDLTAHLSNQYGIFVHIISDLVEIPGYPPEAGAYYLGRCSNPLPGSQGVSVDIYVGAIRYYSAPNVGYDPLDESKLTGYRNPEQVTRIFNPNYALIEDDVDKEAIKSILAHELGHAIVSWEHCPDENCIMYAPFCFDHISHSFCDVCKPKLRLH